MKKQFLIAGLLFTLGWAATVQACRQLPPEIKKSLEKSCKSGEFTKIKESSITQRFRGSIGNGVTGLTDLLIVSADQDYFIPNDEGNWDIVTTSSHNGSIENISHIPLLGYSVIEGEKPLMLQSVSAQFRCHRGPRPFSRRRCTASGKITILQEPVVCAEFLIPKEES